MSNAKRQGQHRVRVLSFNDKSLNKSHQGRGVGVGVGQEMCAYDLTEDPRVRVIVFISRSCAIRLQI